MIDEFIDISGDILLSLIYLRFIVESGWEKEFKGHL